MKVKKANKVNNEIKLNVDKHQDDIIHWKEHLIEKAVCVTCNQKYATNNGLKNMYPRKHIQEQLLWNYCGHVLK